jgi:S-adenosylmethionine hydrolase
VEAPVRLEIRSAVVDGDVLRGEVIAIDGPYGNLITNVDAGDFAKLGWAIGDRVTLEIARERLRLPFVRTFSDVPVGYGLVYVDSRGHLGVALNKSSFAAAHHVAIPSPLTIHKK